MILGHLETVGFKGSLLFDIYVEIQGCARMGLVVLKVFGEDLYWRGNGNQKVFVRMGHVFFVVGSSINELLFDILQLEEHLFGLI